MIPVIFTAAVWAAAVVTGILAVLCAVQAAACTGYDPPEYHHARESAAAAGICAGAAVCAAGFLGVIPGLAAVFAAGATVLSAIVFTWYELGTRGEDDATLSAVMADLGTAMRMAIGEVSQQHRARRARADLLPDELAPRRQRRIAPASFPDDDLPAAAGQAGPPPRRPLPGPDGRNKPPVTMPPPQPPPQGPPPQQPPAPDPGPAAAADALTAVHMLITYALSGGMRGKERVFANLVEMHDRLGAAIHAFAVRLSEPDQLYGEPVWGPVIKMAGFDQAASMAGAEALSMLRALAQMPMGEVAASAAVQAPHHDELNRA